MAEKKIAIRKAPAEKANTYEEGFIAIGSDNNKYIVTVDKNNFKRWSKVPTTEKMVFYEAPEIIVEKPKRAYKKKTPTTEIVVEAPVKPKRAYKKKPKFAEQGTQTDEEVVCTPTKPKKERKIPDTPRKTK